jgi:hypothetical protein
MEIHMKLIKGTLLVLILSAITGCGLFQPEGSTDSAELRFDPKLTMFEAGVVTFRVGAVNEADVDAAPLEQADIEVVVTDAEGEIRNQMYLVGLPAIPAGESVHPLEYEASYEPGVYTVSFEGEGLPDLTLTFRIEEESGMRKLAAHPDWIDPYTEFVITDPDL